MLIADQSYLGFEVLICISYKTYPQKMHVFHPVSSKSEVTNTIQTNWKFHEVKLNHGPAEVYNKGDELHKPFVKYFPKAGRRVWFVL